MSSLMFIIFKYIYQPCLVNLLVYDEQYMAQILLLCFKMVLFALIIFLRLSINMVFLLRLVVLMSEHFHPMLFLFLRPPLDRRRK